MKQNFKHYEYGRSMVEMLGVLSIIGLLSIGGISAYNQVVRKYKVNQLLTEASKRAVIVATFSSEPVEARGKTIAIKLTGLKVDLCEELKKRVGENPSLQRVDGECGLANELALILKKDLLTSDSPISEECENIDCGNYGECVDGACECMDRYYGDRCQYSPETCQNGGEYNSETYSCDNCQGHFAGQHCDKCSAGYQLEGTECKVCSVGTYSAVGAECVPCENGHANECRQVYCNGRGIWNSSTEKCSCDNNSYGDDCSVTQAQANTTYCSDHGTWDGTSCTCSGPAYTGSDCSIVCNGHGTTTDGVSCTCNGRWKGSYCTCYVISNGSYCPTSPEEYTADNNEHCSGRGTWNGTACACSGTSWVGSTGAIISFKWCGSSCSCYYKYSRISDTECNYSASYCPSSEAEFDAANQQHCSGNGIWNGSSCNCHPIDAYGNYYGNDCSLTQAQANTAYCSDHGTWGGSSCTCSGAAYTGLDCSTVCNGHGTTTNGVNCGCTSGWKGSLCECYWPTVRLTRANSYCPASQAEYNAANNEHCSGHGTWNGATCSCSTNWYSSSCACYGISYGSYCPASQAEYDSANTEHCSGHGKWNGTTCSCFADWHSSSCACYGISNGSYCPASQAEYNSANNTHCSGHGAWNGTACNCWNNWSEADCSVEEDDGHCFATDNLITLANGTCKRADQITYEDELLVWNFDKGCFDKAKPIFLQKIKHSDHYNLLKFSDGSVFKMIKEHRIFNREAGKFTYPMTKDTPWGTHTLNAKGEWVTLISGEKICERTTYCNIVTERHLNCFVGNILCSCRLNNLYPIKDLKFVKDNRIIKPYEDFKVLPKRFYDGLRLGEQSMEINHPGDIPLDKDLIGYVQRLMKTGQ